MYGRAKWLGPAVVLGVAGLVLAVSFAGPAAAGPRAAASMPFRAAVPQIVADSASGADANPNGPPSPTATGTATATPTVAANACGSGHASLLSFTDGGAANVARDAVPQTLTFLRTQTRPSPAPADATRVGPVETALYTFEVVLQRMSLLPNGAILLIVGDPPSGGSMRVTLPAASCVTGVASADDRGAINGARTSLRLACGDPPASGSRDLAGTATITGPGYWGATNVSDANPNGAEIGPLLGFTFTGLDCDPTHPTPTPTPTPVLTAVTVGVDLLPGHPGETATAIVTTQPPIGGVACTVQYVNPPAPGVMTGTVDNDPALGPQSTAADGTATWQWKIPDDSPSGEARFEAHCLGHEAVTKVFVVGS